MKDNCHIYIVYQPKETDNIFLDYILAFQRNYIASRPFASWIFPGTLFGSAFLKAVNVTL